MREELDRLESIARIISMTRGRLEHLPIPHGIGSGKWVAEGLKLRINELEAAAIEVSRFVP